jgi:AcrR family transcriptional regulator
MEQTQAVSQKEERRRRILAIALDAFLENGYSRTSMATIAARVGGSKGTLYNTVKNKEELFIACIRAFVETHSQTLFGAIEQGGKPRDVLTTFCRLFLNAIMSETDLALNRLVIAEVDKIPAIGKAFFANGPEFGARHLSAYLEEAMKSGDLRKDDPVKAAKVLFGLCQSGVYQEVLFNVSSPPAQKKIAGEARHAVAVFMAYYGNA